MRFRFCEVLHSGAAMIGYRRRDGRKGAPSKSAALGHQEFILGYRTFEPLGPCCLPV
jgi:hypothetical protein